MYYLIGFFVLSDLLFRLRLIVVLLHCSATLIVALINGFIVILFYCWFLRLRSGLRVARGDVSFFILRFSLFV